MRVDEFDYQLPSHLIAQHPIENRSESRLMVVDPVTKTWQHRRFAQIVEELQSGDVLVVNDSRVLPARLVGEKCDTGGRFELLLLQPTGEDTYTALARPAKRLRQGSTLQFYPKGDLSQPLVGEAEVLKELPDGVREIRFTQMSSSDTLHAYIEKIGVMPLPPYIRAPLKDEERYQTVYARVTGSVAAPTAGLHFTQELLEELRSQGVLIAPVTLHVGLGTFRPVQVEEVSAHQMHSEWYEVPKETADIVNQAHANGKRVVAVGTTALRTLESAGSSGVLQATSGETDIFIYPGYRFRMANALITNFHLPKSTLFMLVSAWMGREFALQVYEAAIAEEYRFFSFGDAMFLKRRGEA